MGAGYVVVVLLVPDSVTFKSPTSCVFSMSNIVRKSEYGEPGTSTVHKYCDSQ